MAGLIAALALLLIGGGLFAGYLGAFGGEVFTIVPARRAPKPQYQGLVAVFFSGDMGFRTGMGPRIASGLAERGIPVIGVNSLAAFSHRRTPGEAAALVRQSVEKALTLPDARSVALIGQSFGANIVLNGAADLPATIRSKVRMVALVVPADTMLFRATPGGIFDRGHDGPALPVARRLTDLPVVCIQGEIEQRSLCPSWRQPNVARVTLPGDHFLHKDAPLVAATLLRALAGEGAFP